MAWAPHLLLWVDPIEVAHKLFALIKTRFLGIIGEMTVAHDALAALSAAYNRNMRQLTPEEKFRIRAAIEDFSQTVHLQTTEELHLFAERWNWDDYAHPLLPIIRNPQCDKGTALYLYWLSDPVDFFEKYATVEEAEAQGEYEVDYYQLISEIQEKFIAGFYTKETFAMIPEEIAVGDLTSDGLKKDIPDLMRQPTKGEVLPQDTFRFYKEPDVLSPEIIDSI